MYLCVIFLMFSEEVLEVRMDRVQKRINLLKTWFC
jgi:hypothetical protein